MTESAARKYFGTDGIRGHANRFPLVPEFVVRLGQVAAEEFLSRRTSTSVWPVVVVGKDTRQSCDMLESAMVAGLNSRGVDVQLAGVIPTPAVAMLAREQQALFGVVISASHNPYHDNGIKFFSPEGYKLDDELEYRIEQRMEEASASPAENGTQVGRSAPLANAQERFIGFVRYGAGGDGNLLSGMTIALDTANGASYETSAAILTSLGARVKAFHHHPSGLNINEDCGCTHPAVIQSLVRETGADVGISHDGDADRVVMCDETGAILDGDEFMAIVATDMLAKGTLRHQTLVSTVMSNAGLEETLARAGGRMVRTGVGDRYVIQEMREHGYNFGGEQSGHFIFHDLNTTGDGITAALQLLRVMRERGQPLSELRGVLTRYPQVLKNVRVRSKPGIDELRAAAKIAGVERELQGRGRIMIRYSGTEPLLRILMEGKDADYIERTSTAIADAIREEIGE